MRKRCSRCGDERPRSEFYKNKSRPDGIQTVCKDCTRANNAEWRAKNPGAHTVHYANYSLSPQQREERAERAKEWRRLNPERKKANDRAWLARHPERARQIAVTREAARRARLNAAFVEHVDPNVVHNRDCGRCGICGDPVDAGNFHLDHIVPLARGGEHSYRNVQLAHPTCNAKKGTRIMPSHSIAVAGVKLA